MKFDVLARRIKRSLSCTKLIPFFIFNTPRRRLSVKKKKKNRTFIPLLQGHEHRRARLLFLTRLTRLAHIFRLLHILNPLIRSQARPQDPSACIPSPCLWSCITTNPYLFSTTARSPSCPVLFPPVCATFFGVFLVLLVLLVLNNNHLQASSSVRLGQERKRYGGCTVGTSSYPEAVCAVF